MGIVDPVPYRCPGQKNSSGKCYNAKVCESIIIRFPNFFTFHVAVIQYFIQYSQN